MSYADDNTPYVYSENVNVTQEELEDVEKVIFKWFSNNFFKGKCWQISSNFKYK